MKGTWRCKLHQWWRHSENNGSQMLPATQLWWSQRSKRPPEHMRDFMQWLTIIREGGLKGSYCETVIVNLRLLYHELIISECNLSRGWDSHVALHFLSTPCCTAVHTKMEHLSVFVISKRRSRCSCSTAGKRKPQKTNTAPQLMSTFWVIYWNVWKENVCV